MSKRTGRFNRSGHTGGKAPDVSVEDFEALLAGTDLDVPFFSPGQEVQGRVVRIERDTLYLDLGGKSEGVLALSDLARSEPEAEGAAPEPPASPELGDVVRAFVVQVRGGVIRLAPTVGRSSDNLDLIFEAHESGIPVQGKIVSVNKGGYEVDLGAARGFCPHSQMDLHFVEQPELFVGRDLRFQVSEVRESGRNVILSRRALLEAEQAVLRAETMARLVVGCECPGVVRSLRPFGAFVDLGGVEGLVHVSEIAHERVEDPADHLSVGQAVNVVVLDITDEGKRISLSMKALQPDPWLDVDERFVVGSRVNGRVVRLAPFGAFVELVPGIDGLLHISTLGGGRRIAHPREVLREGDSVEVMVASVDSVRQRIGLEPADRVGGAAGSGGAAGDAGPAEVGATIEGVVERVERFGVFISIGPGRTGLLPRSEVEGGRDADLRRTFPVDSRVRVKLIEIDEDRGRYTLSQRALAKDEERRLVDTFQQGSSGGGLGTLGDLLRAKLEQRKKR